MNSENTSPQKQQEELTDSLQPTEEASEMVQESIKTSELDESPETPPEVSAITEESLNAVEDSQETKKDSDSSADAVQEVEILLQEYSTPKGNLPPEGSSQAPEAEHIKEEVGNLQREKQALEAEIKALQAQKEQMLSEQAAEVQATLGRMVKESMRELQQRKQALEISVEQLERRRERVREEMRTTFAGVSQDLAIRVQGFKDYLVGSLQDLAAAAEQLDFPSYSEQWQETSPPPTPEPPEAQQASAQPQFAQGQFQNQIRRIEELLDQYRSRPDYYGPPWQLRRTFEPIHAERVQKWFFSQGGRGAIRSMGSRLQNILLASAIISVCKSLYSDRTRVLILADVPERLGEWRRGLQDCLGISRSDFGPERGVGLFEVPEALVQKADRLIEQNYLPLIIIDETDNLVDLSLLQYPLWLAFASEPQQASNNYFF